MMDTQKQHQPHGQATCPRYVVATLPSGDYVVYDRWDARVADGRYLTLTDAQWAADQRNGQQWQQQPEQEAR